MKSISSAESLSPDLVSVLAVAQASLSTKKDALWLSDRLDQVCKGFWDNERVAEYGHLFSANAALCHDTINQAVTCDKIEWMRSVAVSENWSDDRWNRYGILEIENFVIQLRSACDHLTPFIQLLCGKQIPNSFRRLRDRIIDNKYPDSTFLEDLVRYSTWFVELRSIRDAIAHDGANTLILHKPEEGIQFRVAGLLRGDPVHNSVYLIGHRARFNLFAAYYFSHYIWFRDWLGQSLSETLDVPLERTEGLILRRSPLLSWIDDLIQILNLD